MAAPNKKGQKGRWHLKNEAQRKQQNLVLVQCRPSGLTPSLEENNHLLHHVEIKS